MMRVVFYFEETEYPDLKNWLESHPKGDRSATIRDTLDACLKQHGPKARTEPDAVDLPAIRAVVESAVRDTLSGLTLVSGQAQSDDEADELLGELDSNLLLD